MKTKLIIAGAGVLVLYLYWLKKKKNKAKEEKLIEESLPVNMAMPAAQQIDIIRLKLDDFMKYQFPFMTEEERVYRIVDLTSNLDTYQQQYTE
jgi:hypothetical protein